MTGVPSYTMTSDTGQTFRVYSRRDFRAAAAQALQDAARNRRNSHARNPMHATVPALTFPDRNTICIRLSPESVLIVE